MTALPCPPPLGLPVQTHGKHRVHPHRRPLVHALTRATLTGYMFRAFLTLCAFGATSGGCSDVYLDTELAVLQAPVAIEFSPVALGSTDTTSFRLQNNGGRALRIESVEFDNPSGAFALEGLSVGRLSPGDAMEVMVTHAPRTAINNRATIIIRYDNGYTTEQVLVLVRVGEPIIDLRASPALVELGPFDQGAPTRQVVRLTNYSSVGITITNVNIHGRGDEFPVDELSTNPLPRSLAPGAWMDVEISIDPEPRAPALASLQFAYHVDGSNVSGSKNVPLTLVPYSPCVTTDRPDGIDFGERRIDRSYAEMITIENCTDPEYRQNLEVFGIQLLQADSSAFALLSAPQSPFIIPPGGTRSFEVVYTPTGAGVVDTAAVELTTDAALSAPLRIELSGFGTDNLCPTARVQCAADGGDKPESDMLTAYPLSTIRCTASESSDDDGDIAGYEWTLTTPSESTTALSAIDASTVSFVADVKGIYEVSLLVQDDQGKPACNAAQMLVDVDRPAALTVELIWTTAGDLDAHDTGRGAGTDMDLHLLALDEGCWSDPRGDCASGNPNPDWGVRREPADDPTLSRNDRDGWGPEHIAINEPAPGVFRVGVQYIDASNFGPSTATVRVYIDGVLASEFSRALTESGQFWEVADIEWPSGNVTTLGREFRAIGGANCE